MLQKIRNTIDISKDSTYTITLKHHIIFWLIYFLFTTFRWGSYFNDYGYAFKTTALGFSIHMLLSYFNIYYLMPKFVYNRKYLLYVTLLIASLFIMLLIKFYLTYFLISQNVWPEGPEVTNKLTLNYSIEMMLGELYVLTFVTAIKVTLDWLKEHKKLIEVEKLQLETELKFLRTQISPHFFFNTTHQKRQSLSKEIACLQNYLDLERIRRGDLLIINMGISGEIEDKKIAPMLLLSFIENAFKHGVNKNIGVVEIDIDFNIIDDFLYFRISNPLPTITNNDKMVPDPREGGIGMGNVKKRLKLGYQKEAYNLDITTNDRQYIVDLKIKV